MPRNLAVGIDIGTHAVQTAVAEWTKNSDKLRILGTGTATSDGVRRGSVENISDAARALKESVGRAERSAGVRITSAFFSFGGASLTSSLSRGQIVVSGDASEISSSDINRALESSHAVLLPLANKTVLHRIPVIFRVDNTILTHAPKGLSGSRLEVDTLFVTGLAPHAENIILAAGQAGISVSGLVASPIAAAEAVLTKRQKEVGVMLLDIGAGSITSAIFEEGRPISVESFPIGSASITNDLAIGLKIGIEDAETLKQSSSSFQGPEKKKVEEIITARARDIFEIVFRHLKKFGRDGLLPAGVVLCGGGANLEGIQDLARFELELPVMRGRFLDTETARGDLLDPSWASAIGLCHIARNNFNNSPGLLGIPLPRPGSRLLRWLRAFLP